MERRTLPMNSLTARLLVFNILLVFVPAIALILLDTYEKQLLVLQEKAMVQQGRIFAAALSDRPLEEEAHAVLNSLEGRLEARIRIVNRNGELLADSAVDGQKAAPVQEAPNARKILNSNPTPKEIQKTLLYRLAVTPIRLFRKHILPPAPPYSRGEFYSEKTVLTGPEIAAALKGHYGAATRISSGGQKSVNLYCAIPIQSSTGDIQGAVLVTQSTYKILDNLYRIRLDIIRIFLFYLLGSAAFSLILSRTIAVPLKKLRDQAEQFLDAHGQVAGCIVPLYRSDEIGDLSRSLNQMTCRLEERIRFTEDFFSDILHEVKNPLMAIRSSAELAETGANKEDTGRFLAMIQNETEKMEKLLSSLREISRIHTGLLGEEESLFDLGELLSDLATAFSLRKDINITIQVVHKGETFPFYGNRDRMAQVLTNLLENATSFSPPGSCVSAEISKSEETLTIRLQDSGPGIPEDDLNRIFNRFYSTRKKAGEHQGLGLSIVKSILEGYGGNITGQNNPEGGALFTLNVPAAIIRS